MTTISLKDAKASFSNVIDKAASGEFVTITRHGRPAAVLVSPNVAEAARNALGQGRPNLAEYIKTFPSDIDLDDDVFARNRTPSRDVDL